MPLTDLSALTDEQRSLDLRDVGQARVGDTGVAVAYGSVLILTMLIFTLLVQLVTGRSRTDKQVKTI